MPKRSQLAVTYTSRKFIYFS